MAKSCGRGRGTKTGDEGIGGRRRERAIELLGCCLNAF
jgi:hypothetical protein